MASKTKRQPVDPRIPRSNKLLQVTFHALKQLGGTGSNEEILEQIIKDLGITDEVASIPHKGNPNFTELAYQVAWARTYLNQYGVIENIGRSRWSIRTEYKETDKIDEELIIKTVTAKSDSKQEQDVKNNNNNKENQNGTRTYLFKKNVDKSLLKAGLTIPKDSYSKLSEAVQVTLTKGEKTDLTVFIEDNSYKVTLTNVNLDENISTREVLQIRYSEGSAICK